MDNTGKIVLVLMLVGVGALGGYLFAQEAPPDAPQQKASMHEQMDSMTANLEGLEGTAFDYAFAQEMIVHHEGAIDMALLAKEKSQNPDVQDLADAIISAQEAEIAMMNGWIAMWEASSDHPHEDAHPQ